MKYPKISTASDIPAALRDMRLSAMAAAYEQDMADPSANLKTFSERFAEIITAEQDYRKTKKTSKYLKYAHLKMPDADLSAFDTCADRQMNMDTLARLSTCEWIPQKLNLIITGPCGCGKTWLACALGARACENFMSVRFYPVNRLILRMKTYPAEVYLQKINEIADLDLLILDDIGLQSYDLESCRIFYEILDSRYKAGSTMFISQFPVSTWSDLFADKTYGNGVLSRNIENACRLEISGEDLRLRKQPDLDKAAQS
jgi:DNA replication protein DnaC